MRSCTLARLGACLLSVLAFAAAAENSTSAGVYTVHHNAISTDTLSPDIAKSYKIVRSRYRGLLTVSVIREQEGTTGTPVSARVDARSVNLAGQLRNLVRREIREGDGVYYLGEFPIVDREILKFSLLVTPAGEQRPIEANLSQQFFID